MNSKPYGLYFHIPFCSKICSYCDFAKTSNFSQSHVHEYFLRLEFLFDAWIKHLGVEHRFSSVFFGGGTPGLFTSEYESLLVKIRPFLASECEVTLEANPNNISKENVATWSDLGFNRLSIGVQTFDPIGLKAMTRDHSHQDAIEAVNIASEYFANLNIDLIYGWPGQTRESWLNDLEEAAKSRVKHLSLYALTIEGQTPFARAQRRGKTIEANDDVQLRNYEDAQEILKIAGFHQEEVSNWSKPGFSCRHNWIYWTAQNYIGIGAGAHGFILDETKIGMRYSYPKDFRAFLRSSETPNIFDPIDIDRDRDSESWLLEYVGCALRCVGGINLKYIETMGFKFKKSPAVSRAIDANLLVLDKDLLTLQPNEWFRETSWSLLVADCFAANSDS